jgi:hypothetical protein
MKRTPAKKFKQDGNEDAESVAGREGQKTQECTTSVKDQPTAGTNSTNNANNPPVSGANSTNGTSSRVARTNSTNDANDPKASGANSTNGTIDTHTANTNNYDNNANAKRRAMHHPMYNKQPSPKELPTVTKATLSNQIVNMQTMMHLVKKIMRM